MDFLLKCENAVKYSLGIFFCIIFRLVLLPFPNIEPVMGTTMPFAKKFGKYAGFFFAFFTLIVLDFITNRAGVWTLYCGLAYGMVGYAASAYLGRMEKVGRREFVLFAIGGTIAYDAVTALIFGWQFGQPLLVTVIGQIPFTIYHLAGNIAFSFFLSPLIHQFVVENKSLTLSACIRRCPLPMRKGP